ncbi:hypothetical protein TNIN_384411 [Trichonephila inaurata madagascariensis]|uniref:Uncharacterized protein n=1 Tax=Trichonephila inaurata madagascariensis TaxID=2747483 RepID=A0A8X6MHQ1_9ARAC|nr:hypothetical protein TNIN_384411 [Trichonephila inaurata madagascariensis]
MLYGSCWQPKARRTSSQQIFTGTPFLMKVKQPGNFCNTDITKDYIALKSKLDSIKSIIKELDILQNDYCALPDKVNLKDSLDTLSDLQDEAEETKWLFEHFSSAKQLKQELISLFSGAGMQLHKLSSNCIELLSNFDISDGDVSLTIPDETKALGL